MELNAQVCLCKRFSSVYILCWCNQAVNVSGLSQTATRPEVPPVRTHCKHPNIWQQSNWTFIHYLTKISPWIWRARVCNDMHTLWSAYSLQFAFYVFVHMGRIFLYYISVVQGYCPLVYWHFLRCIYGICIYKYLADRRANKASWKSRWSLDCCLAHAGSLALQHHCLCYAWCCFLCFLSAGAVVSCTTDWRMRDSHSSHNMIITRLAFFLEGEFKTIRFHSFYCQNDVIQVSSCWH